MLTTNWTLYLGDWDQALVGMIKWLMFQCQILNNTIYWMSNSKCYVHIIFVSADGYLSFPNGVALFNFSSFYQFCLGGMI